MLLNSSKICGICDINTHKNNIKLVIAKMCNLMDHEKYKNIVIYSENNIDLGSINLKRATNNSMYWNLNKSK